MAKALPPKAASAIKKPDIASYKSLKARTDNEPAGAGADLAIPRKDEALKEKTVKNFQSNYLEKQEDVVANAPAPMESAAEQSKSLPEPAKKLAGVEVPKVAASQSLPRAESMSAPAAVGGFAPQPSSTIFSGNNGASSTESELLVTDTNTFAVYWQVFRPQETPPAVDFTRQAVIVLLAGQKPTAGYSIHVSQLEDKPDQFVIHYRVENPPSGAITAQILTSPWFMQIIPKPSKPVVFQKD
jgi:hypothetical protein